MKFAEAEEACVPGTLMLAPVFRVREMQMGHGEDKILSITFR
ncbi:MAG: hypothetical protein E6124_25325 [Blautia producta]|nr:hypothetical protein [Leclercia sp. EC_58]MDU5385484.1 hypothetical protein [Blautia producta]